MCPCDAMSAHGRGEEAILSRRGNGKKCGVVAAIPARGVRMIYRGMWRLGVTAGVLWASASLRSEAPSPASSEPWSPAALRADMRRLAPLTKALPAADDGDWRASFRENAQSFRQWLASTPVTSTATRRVILVQPVGEFTAAQRQVLRLTSAHLGLFYGLPVQTLKDVPVSVFPPAAQRRYGAGKRQLLATHLLDVVLPPLRRDDAVFVVALTAEDLWPGEGWNYVFGMASLQARVGVWSLHRFGDPAADAEAYHTCLRRAIKVATHESGHMFSITHCVTAHCGMNGANSLSEADGQPLEFCPTCLAKLAHAARFDPRTRTAALKTWYAENGFADEALECGAMLAALARPDPRPAAPEPESPPVNADAARPPNAAEGGGARARRPVR